MAYKNNRIFHYDDSAFMAFLRKPNVFYILCSFCFCVAVIGFYWGQHFNPKLDESISLYQFNSLSSIFNLFSYFISLLGLCVLTGAFLSIPAIACRNLLNFIILKQRKKYKRIVNLVLLAQYLPYLFLILSNVLFYQINLSTSLHHDLLYNFKLTRLQNAYMKLGQKNPSAQYIFLVPSYLIEDQDKLTQTKSLLPFQNVFFMETSAKSEIVAQLMQNETTNIAQYYAPVPMHKIQYSKKPQEHFSIGVDRKDSTEFLGLFSNHLAEKKQFKFTKSTILVNHTIAALKPIQFVLKSNFPGFLNKNWRWDNFGNTPLDVLLKYADQNKKQSVHYHIMMLPNPKDDSKKNFLLASSNFISSDDLPKIENTFDTDLYTAIKTLLKSDANNIFVLPYASELESESKTMQLSNFLSATKSNEELKSYRTVLTQNQTHFSCSSQFMQNHSSDSEHFDHKKMINKIQFSKNGTVYLNPKYMIYINDFFTNALICYDNGKNIFLLKAKVNNIQNQIDKSFFIHNIDILKFDGTKTTHVLIDKEKSDFFDKYKYEIFKS